LNRAICLVVVRDLGEQFVIVVDAEGVVGRFDGKSASRVGHADVDALPGNHESAAAADPPFHPQGFGCGLGWWSGGAGVADAGLFSGGQRVGQAPSETSCSRPRSRRTVRRRPREVVADGVLPAGKADQAVAVDQAVDFDRVAGPAGRDRWWAGGSGIVGQ